jgi:site-specific recombinase XerD
MRMNATLPELMHAFFHNWLAEQRNCSRHTVLSYRDAWCLFLRFVAERRKRSVAQISFTDITANEIVAFLNHIEQERKVSIGTRNCRLAALRSFFSFVASHEPLAAAQCAEVLRIPIKRGPRRVVNYLESDEVTALLRQPDRSTLLGQRDHVLMSLLYNTGARIQEALNLRLQDIRLEPPAHVRLFGKGRKERICPLWPETVDLLKKLLERAPRNENQVFFANRYGRPLGASGVRFKLKQYVVAAAKQFPSLPSKRVTPHVFRHATAVALVDAGVDLTVIRSWLGHASLDTTNIYARANLETKRRALEQVDPSSKPAKPARWKRDADLLAWLESL